MTDDYLVYQVRGKIPFAPNIIRVHNKEREEIIL